MRLICCRCHQSGPDIPDAKPDTPFICRQCAGRRGAKRSLPGYRPRPRRRPLDDADDWTAEEEQAWHEKIRLEEEFRQKEQEEQRSSILGLLRNFAEWSNLSQDELVVLEGYTFQGKTVREVAAETGVSKSQVERIAQRAARKLIRTVKPLSNSSRLTPYQAEMFAAAHETLSRDDYLDEKPARNMQGKALSFEQATGIGDWDAD